jgi:hypothetical protein
MAATPANSVNQNSTSSGLWTWDGTATASTTAMAQYNVVVGASANTIQNEAPGSAGNVLTSNGASSYPTFQAIPYTQMPWTDKATSFNAAAGNGYFVTATATATMPASPLQGNTISFEVDGVGSLLTITANTGQIIRAGKTVSAAAGTCVNNFQGDSITLVYRASDTSWQAISVIGTWTIT